MQSERTRPLDKAVWIPLRATQKQKSNVEYGHIGYTEDFLGMGTVAIRRDCRPNASTLSWSDIGLNGSPKPTVEGDRFIGSDEYEHYSGEISGKHLVLVNTIGGDHHDEWLPHPDLVIGFGLLREGDQWIAPQYGYEIVIRLLRDNDGVPSSIEIRSEFLKDYLKASGSALFATSYRQRIEVVEQSTFEWELNQSRFQATGVRWEGRIDDIHEGGDFFGSSIHIFHSAHAGVDTEQDVPVLPEVGKGRFDSKAWIRKSEGRKLQKISGELWKDEWVEPATTSHRIGDDLPPDTNFFTIDGEGTQVSTTALIDSARWLWFRPEVVPALTHRRGGRLGWYSRHTGAISCGPGTGVHFGVNSIGLINVYAKDIAMLPSWLIRRWAGFNVGPNGGVSQELQASQVLAKPADTQAPEVFLLKGIGLLGQITADRFGTSIIRVHAEVEGIAARCHRFRATDREGLVALAKDLARLTADLIDAKVIHKELVLKPKERPGSLKSLELLLAKYVSAKQARETLGPLVGIYELRHVDAHLPPSDQARAFHLAQINESTPFIQQGLQLLTSCVSALYKISGILRDSKEPTP